MRARIITWAASIALLASPGAIADNTLVERVACEELTDIFQTAGYRFETDGIDWLIAPDGTRLRFVFHRDADGLCRGFRISALWAVGDSQPALAAALYYESTNPLAAVRFHEGDGGTIIELGRGVVFGPGRSRANLLAHVELTLSLVPHFQHALVNSDPELRQVWQNATGAAE
ncbi:type III secretion system chaperone family protein [Maricaulis sp. CAU 1757]